MDTFMEKYDKVFDLLDQNQVAEAMAIGQELVDHNADNSLSWFAYGVAKKTWGDIPLAIKGLEQAVQLDPTNYMIYTVLGECYRDNEQIEQAFSAFEKAIELNNQDFNLWVDYIILIETYIGVDAAIEKCNYAMSILPTKEEMENTLGILYIDKAFDNMVELIDNPEDPESSSTMAFISLTDIKESRELCKKAKVLITKTDNAFFSDYLDKCNEILRICDADQYTKSRMSNISFLAIHAVITVIYSFFLCYFIIGIPMIFIAPIVTFLANRFPAYMYNFAEYHGSNDPLVYKETSKATRGDVVVGRGTLDDLSAGVIRCHFWVIRTRIAFYKRFINERKEKKNNN